MSIGFDAFAPTDQDDTDATQESVGDEQDAGHSPAEGEYDAGAEADAGGEDERDREQPKGAAKSRKPARVDKGLIRRSAAKAIELVEADAKDVKLLASLLSSSTDPVSLAVAVMTSTRGDTSALSDVRALADSSQAERAVTVMTMSKAKMRGIWQVLAHVGALPGRPPASDSKAALAVADVAIDETVLARVDAVSVLARKG